MVIAGMDCFSIDQFTLEYIQSAVDHPVLWESHCHMQYELIGVAEGDITVMLEGRNCRLTKNQAIIIPPLAYHSVTANKKGTYRRITALFSIDTIPPALQPEFMKRKTDGIIFPFHYAEKLKALCQAGNRAFYAPLGESLMIQLFYDAIQESQNLAEVKTDDFLEKALQYIEQHLHEKISLDQLAKHTARSKSSFCHLFAQKMNISPKQYILQKKFAMASKLIDEGTPHTIAAIQVGYENYSSFYRLYCKNLHKLSAQNATAFGAETGRLPSP